MYISSFELQKPGWLLIFFTTVALAVPFEMFFRHGQRVFRVALLGAHPDILEDEETIFAYWLYFIYDKAPEAVGYAQSMLGKCVGNAQIVLGKCVGVGNNPHIGINGI